MAFGNEAGLAPPSERSDSSGIEIAAKEKEPPARTVFISLEKVKEAERYDVEIIPVTLKWSEPLSFSTFAGALRIRLTPSIYRIRTRSVKKGGGRGGWGEWKDFEVPYRNVTARTPADKAIIRSTGYENQIVTFEWPKAADAPGYYLEVHSATGTPIKKIATAERWLNLELPVGHEYSWCLLPVTKMPPSVAPDDCHFTQFRIRESSTELPHALTAIDPRKGAIGYQFEVIRFEDAKSLGDPVTIQSVEPELKAQLEPGEYELRARALFEQDHKTGWSSPKKFFVPHRPPEPLSPVMGGEIEGEEDENGRITLAWREEPGAADYTVTLFKADGQIIDTKNTKETQAEFLLPEDAKYYWQVSAYSKGEPRRSPASATLDPKNASEFYIKPYYPFNLTAAEAPAPFYGWARYTISSADYYSESYDDNAIVRQSIQAGRLELATGYWHRKTHLGVLLDGGIQNYRTPTESNYQKGGAISLGYRFFGEGDRRAQVWLGYAYREIPSLVANPSTLTYRISHLSSAGPQLRFIVSDMFSEKFGYQLHGRLFLGTKDLGSPNGQPQESALALAASTALTYRLSETSIGLLGYTYQLDNGSYRSADTPGHVNKTSLTGHYLTFGLEIALEKPKR